VPNNVVSLVDFNLRLNESTSYDEILETIKKAAERKELRNILAVTDKEVVATDMIRSPYSAPTVDRCAGNIVGENFCKLVAWHDDEWGYSRRLCELLWHVAKQDEKRGQ
jgi:glyceraldehyde 3-phosphate dehydrogenase